MSARKRIAVDTRGWLSAGRGIDLYTSNILRRWASAPEIALTLVAPRTGEVPEVSAPVRRVSLMQVMPRRRRAGSAIPAIERDHDAIFLPNLGFYPSVMRVPIVITVHDATSLLRPQEFTARDRLWQRMVSPRSLLRSATTLLANSEQTRRELLSLGLDESRIRVIYHGIGDHYRPTTLAQTRATLTKYGIPERPYFLYLGAVEQRKNVARLIDGFLTARSRGLDALLVIAGPVREPDQLAKATDSVKVLGWISADDKAPLYSGASAAVSVAKHEGFGMLPLEAFACGTQSILSPLSVYRETLGDQAIYVSSDDPDAIAESLIAWRASTPAPDAAEVEQLRAKFSWDKCARDSLCEILKAIE